MTPASAQPTAVSARHPRGLYTLFFTEMWERFSYYGMRALLVLFLVDQVRGGLGLSDAVANAIYGLYTAAVYLAALPGGWVADRFLGAQRSVWLGGVLIALGQFTLAFSRGSGFYLGLLLIVLGTGLLKPNVSTIVGELYPEGGARRDAGFTIFYMGINLGAALGPLVAGVLGETLNWHYGFAAAGIGMVFGLIQFRLTRRHLGQAGLAPGHGEGVRRRDWLLLAGALAALVVLVAAVLAGVIRIDPLKLARGTTYLIVGVALIYFLVLFFFFDLDPTEKKRVGVIGVLFVASAMFWSGFEQAGSSLNLFAKRYTQRVVCPSPLLTTNDLKDVALIVQALELDQENVAILRLREHLPSDTEQRLRNPSAGSVDALRQGLVEGFNQCLRDPSLAAAETLQRLPLSADVRDLIPTQLTAEEVPRYNRILLAAALPDAITRGYTEVPASWFQSLGPVFIITLAPVMAALWLWLARRQREPSLPVKFALGLLLLALGFLVMAGAAGVAAFGGKAWPTWLIATYLVHSFGELCLSPVGLSSVTKLAPRRLVGQMMGLWFLATSLGNLIAGLIAGGVSAEGAGEMSTRYLQIVLSAGATGVLLLLLARPIRRLMAGVK